MPRVPPCGILSHLRTAPSRSPLTQEGYLLRCSGPDPWSRDVSYLFTSKQSAGPSGSALKFVRGESEGFSPPPVHLLAPCAVIPRLAVQEPPQPRPPCLPALVPQSLLLPPPQPGDPSHCPGFSRFHLAQSQVPSRLAQPSTACSWLPAASCPPLSPPSLAVTCPFLEHTWHAPVPWPLNLTCLPSSSTVRALISSFSSSPPVSPHRAASLPPTQAWGAHPRTWAHSSP